jgi:hypothetical protein
MGTGIKYKKDLNLLSDPFLCLKIYVSDCFKHFRKLITFQNYSRTHKISGSANGILPLAFLWQQLIKW